MKPTKLSFLDRHLSLWIVLAMLLGIGLSVCFPSVPQGLQAMSLDGVSLPIAMGLMLMMYPPLAKVDYGQLHTVFQDRRTLALSLLQNWVVGPVLMFVLAVVFLHDQPDYMTGLILIGLARCIAMVLIWNQLAQGDTQYAAALVAFNSVFQIVFFSAYAWLFLGYLPSVLGLNTHMVAIEFKVVWQSVLLYLGVPFALGWLTRSVLLRWRGNAWYQQVFLPKISPLALWALLFTIVMMFALKGTDVVRLPVDVLRIAIPLCLYFGLMFASSYWLSKRLGNDDAKTTALAFTAAGNNFELALAVAIATFGLTSPVAFTTIIGPLVEVPMLLLLVRVALRLQAASQQKVHPK